MGLVLGLHGPAGSGKDTIADYLVENKGWEQKISFAQNLKEICKSVFFLSDYDLNDQEGKRKEFLAPKEFTDRNLGSVLYLMAMTHGHQPLPKGAKEKVRALVGTKLYSPRHIIQFIGTDICRTLIPNYHVDIVKNKINKNRDLNYVVTDVRFPNEAELIKNEFDGKVVFVSRDNLTQTGVNREHASETSMQGWGRYDDVLDNNNDGLDYLYKEVDHFLERNNLCLDAPKTVL